MSEKQTDRQLEKVVEDEVRVQELRAAKEKQPTDEKVVVDDPPTIQKGTISDYKRTNDNYVFTVETNYEQLKISVSMIDEYSLDEELVKLLEWSDIDDGQIGDLVGQSVYVNKDDSEFILPKSTSPLSKLNTRLKVAINRAIGENIPEGPYMICTLVSLIIGIPIIEFLESFGFSSVSMFMFMIAFGLVICPMTFIATYALLRIPYDKAKLAWKKRYHEI